MIQQNNIWTLIDEKAFEFESESVGGVIVYPLRESSFHTKRDQAAGLLSGPLGTSTWKACNNQIIINITHQHRWDIGIIDYC